MKKRLNWTLGLALRFALIMALIGGIWIYRGGFDDVTEALGRAGWVALLAICAWHPVAVVLCGVAQRVLIAGGRAWTFVLARWIHESVNELAGFIPMSGEMSVARVLTRRGYAATQGAALAIVDLTTEGLAQFVFVAVGVALWFTHHPGGEVGRWALIGLIASLPLIVLFMIIQRSTVVRFVETLPARLMPKQFSAPEESQGTLAAIHALYASRGRLAAGSTLHLAAWFAGTGEAFIALIMLGHALPLGDVIAMEAFITALRGVAFFVPGALGVQEGAYLVIGAALGLPPEAALAVSLLKRGREVVYGVPGLVAWQAVEAKGRERKPA